MIVDLTYFTSNGDKYLTTCYVSEADDIFQEIKQMLENKTLPESNGVAFDTLIEFNGYKGLVKCK